MKRLYARFVWWLIRPALQHKSEVELAQWLAGAPARAERMRKWTSETVRWSLSNTGQFEFTPCDAASSEAPNDRPTAI